MHEGILIHVKTRRLIVASCMIPLYIILYMYHNRSIQKVPHFYGHNDTTCIAHATAKQAFTFTLKFVLNITSHNTKQTQQKVPNMPSPVPLHNCIIEYLLMIVNSGFIISTVLAF